MQNYQNLKNILFKILLNHLTIQSIHLFSYFIKTTLKI